VATSQEIEMFLKKRGFESDVWVQDNTFVVHLHAKSVDDVAAVLAQCKESARFVVAVHPGDIVSMVMEGGEIPEQFKAIWSKVENVEQANRAMAASLGRNIAELEGRVAVLEAKKPWWRFW